MITKKGKMDPQKEGPYFFESPPSTSYYLAHQGGLTALWNLFHLKIQRNAPDKFVNKICIFNFHLFQLILFPSENQKEKHTLATVWFPTPMPSPLHPPLLQSFTIIQFEKQVQKTLPGLATHTVSRNTPL